MYQLLILVVDYLWTVSAGSLLVCGFQYSDVVVQRHVYAGIMANVRHLATGYNIAFGSR